MFLRGDRYPRLYYKYTCNFPARERPLLSRRRTQHTSTVLTCARYLPTQPYTVRIRCTVTCIVYGRYHICLRMNPTRNLRLISFSFVLPWLAFCTTTLYPLCLSRRSSCCRVPRPTTRGIKYNKDIQWELIGYLRIYRPLWAALLRWSRDGARSTASLFSSRSRSFFSRSPAQLLLLSYSFFVFHLFAGRAAGSNGDIPRRNNIEARF